MGGRPDAALTAPMNWMAWLKRVFDIDLSPRPVR